MVLTVCSLSVVSVLPASAAGDLPRLVDMADLLSDSEESDLSDMLDEISERQQVDISMDEREWYISTCGYGISAITDAGREYISELFVSDLSAGDYAAAFTNFASLCDDFITQAKTGEPYDVGNLPDDAAFEPVWGLLVALAVGFVISLIATGIMRGQLKSVYSQYTANNYIKQGSMQLTKKNDLYLYKHIDRRKKAESSSSSSSHSSGGSRTHTSSSGSRHGGGGGKF